MSPDLHQAITAFNEWRTTRTTRNQTPPHLKQLAVSLVGGYPTTQICEQLRVNNKALKVWVSEQKQTSEFITLPVSCSPAPTNTSGDITLKLSTPIG